MRITERFFPFSRAVSFNFFFFFFHLHDIIRAVNGYRYMGDCKSFNLRVITRFKKKKKKNTLHRRALIRRAERLIEQLPSRNNHLRPTEYLIRKIDDDGDFSRKIRKSIIL